jgi:DNA-directed RNA polymerase specialized sigma24 family protein
MDRAAAIAELPEAYATAVQLVDAGVNEEQIAEQIGIELEAVGPLLRVARAKLARALAITGQGGREAGPTVTQSCQSDSPCGGHLP